MKYLSLAVLCAVLSGCVSLKKHRELEKACNLLSENCDMLMGASGQMIEAHREIGERLEKCEGGVRGF